jgi:hypothetical protein
LQELSGLALFFPDAKNFASPKLKGATSMKRFLMTAVLACTLSVSAFAGEMPTGGIPAPGPEGTTQTTSSTSPGEVPTGGLAEQISVAALSALLTVLGLVAV